MTRTTVAKSDEHTFLRRRALALWDEGLFREARRLFHVIDREQARRIAADLKAIEAEARKKV